VPSTTVIEAARDAIAAFGNTAFDESVKGCTKVHVGENSRTIEVLIDLDTRLASEDERTEAFRLALVTYLVAAGWSAEYAEAMRQPTFDLVVDHESHLWHARNARRAALLLQAKLL
jgi:hypothetical protein